MALRAVSIVNLEGSIRAEFDQRLNEIQRSIRQQEQNAAQSGEDGNQDTEDSNDRVTENSTNNNNHDTEVPDMTEDGDLGRAPEDRSRSIDIRVDYDAFPEVEAASISGDSINDTLSEEIRRLSSHDTRNMTCCQFYKQHWVGHMVTGILSGCLFIVLGIIFLVNDDFPLYAGITLIILGLAPCCMAMNRYRYARLYERERRRALRRLGAIRNNHRMHLREERRRNRQVYPDNPPAYDNLGYGSDEERGETENHGAGTGSPPEVPFVLPTYEQCIKKEEDEGSVKTLSTIEDFAGEDAVDRLAPGNLNANNNNNTDMPPEQEESTSINIDSEQVEVIPIEDNIEIIDSHFVNDETQSDGVSGATSSQYNNDAFENDIADQA